MPAVKESVYVLELPGKGPMLALDTADRERRRAFVGICRRIFREASDAGLGYWGFFQIGAAEESGLAAWEIWGDITGSTAQELLDRVKRDLDSAGFAA